MYFFSTYKNYIMLHVKSYTGSYFEYFQRENYTDCLKWTLFLINRRIILVNT